jgi:diguanylate cyclase (GGDEF)-like protein/PAS domain S-box-containing protein
MNLSVTKKLSVVFCLGLLWLAGIGYLLYSDATLRKTFQGPAEPDRALLKTASDDLRSGMKDLDAAERAYSLSGAPNDLTAARSAAAVVRHAAGELKTLFEDDAERLRDLGRITSLIERRVQYFEQIVVARKRSNKKAVDALMKNGSGRLLSQQIAASLSEFEQKGPSENTYRGEMLSRRFRSVASLMIAGFAGALAIVLLAMTIIGREFAYRRQSDRAMQDLQERQRVSADGFNDSALFTLDPAGTINTWNAAAERLHGFSSNEAQGKHYSLLFPREDVLLGKPENCLTQAQENGRFEYIGRNLRRDGSPFQAHTVITPARDQAGTVCGFSVATRDVTELSRAEALLKKLSMTLEQTADVIVITDRHGKMEFVNKAAEEVTGFSRDEFVSGGMDLLQIREQNAKQYQELWDTVLSGRTYQAELVGVGKSGELIHLDEVVTPIKDDAGKVSHAVFTGTDITPIKLMRNKLDFLASYDALTGLPNRELFADRLNRDMARISPARGVVAVLAIDIDRFKYINEIYGLEAGNKILKQVADSLSVSVSKGDTVGRMGSDEFGIVLHDIKRPADVLLFVKMIMKNVPQIIMSGGEEISVTLTAGIAVYPTDGRDALMLMKNADTALSKAKALGRNRYQFYTPDMNVGITELVFMEHRLSEALKNKEYVLTFQPYCYLSTRKVAGAEALLKWNNEEFGQVSPSKFIPMLEETGLIIDVGKWVLTTACRQIKEWTNGNASMPVSVNLSPNQFRHEHLVETVDRTIRETGIDPHRLILEVTESTFMKNQEFAVSVLTRLKALGVYIAIDDFGTGYSSLSYLKKFPADFVKIDQSFVKDVATDPDTTSLVTAIISMAHGLNLKSIAEGIETEEQWNILRLLKCDMGQGFYFSHSLSPKDFEKLMS